ncbi:hypothetical protein EYA82_05915 [Burkholderia pseudomallei]|nr:hypothetical protein EYA82_05915 [Burkholderia pseudomallei]
MQATGSRQQAAGDRQQATGDRQQATGNRQQATGDRQQATGNRQQAASEGRGEAKGDQRQVRSRIPRKGDEAYARDSRAGVPHAAPRPSIVGRDMGGPMDGRYGPA